MLRYRDIPTHTTEVLDLTSLTGDEFAALVPPFAAAFLSYMAAWTLHGRRRQSRCYTTYKNFPLPAPEDRLLFILVSLKQHTMHTLHGCVFGMRQSKANPWRHVFLPVWRCAPPCAPWGMPPAAVWTPCAHDVGWRCCPCSWSHPRWKPPQPPHPQRPPFLP